MKAKEIYEYAKNELGLHVQRITNEQSWIAATESAFLIANVIRKKKKEVIELNYGPLGEDMRKQAPFQEPIGFSGKNWAAIKLNDSRYDELIKSELKKLNGWAKEARERQIAGNMSKKVSEKITMMRIMYDEKLSPEQNFYRQGKWMEDFKDSYREKTAFDDPKPCYQNMTDQQLRRYFTLRKDFKDGKFPAEFNSYLLLYISELFNQIGSSMFTVNLTFALNMMLKSYRHTSYYDLIRDYMDSLSVIQEGKNVFHFNVEIKSQVLSALDPENKVSADVFYEALVAYLGKELTSSYYVNNKIGYIVLLERIFNALDERYHFFNHYVAETKIEPFKALDHLYRCFPLKSDTFYMYDQKLIYHDEKWSVEKYLRPKRVRTVQALVDELDRQLTLSNSNKKKNKSNAPNFIKKTVTEFVRSDWPKLSAPSIRAMRELSDPKLGYLENFYQQGKYMENFTCTSLSFLSIPEEATYDELSDKQLTSYFSWRTKVRNGQYIRNDNYLYLYISEIVNDIGVENPYHGFNTLIVLYDHFPDVETIGQIISEYVITHQLSDKYPILTSREISASRLDPDHLGSDRDILEALRAFEDDFGKNNDLYRKNSREADQLLVRVYRELTKKPSFFRDHIATPDVTVLPLYEPYHYYERHHHKITVQLADSVSYEYSAFGGIWYYHGYDLSDCEIDLLSGAMNAAITSVYDQTAVEITIDEEKLFDMVLPIVLRFLKPKKGQRSTKLKDQKHFDDVREKVRAAMEIGGSSEYDCFMKQAKAMENLTLQEIKRLYPIDYYIEDYSYLNENELMSYLYLRTKWRRGEFSEYNELGIYIRLFAIEVINGIGVKDPQQGYAMVKNIVRWYNRLKRTYHLWPLDYLPFDYMLAHHLENKDFSYMVEADQRIMDLIPHFSKDADTFFNHLQQYLKFNSGYNMCSSPIYKKNPELFKELIFDVLSELEKDPKADLIETVVAEHVYGRYDFFAKLPYQYPEDHYETYQLDPINFFKEGVDGRIYANYYKAKKGTSAYKNVIREIDARARRLLGVKRVLKIKRINAAIDQALDRIVKEVVKKLTEEKLPEEVKINFSGLDQIRQDALVTSEKLLTEEEKADEIVSKPEPAKRDDKGLLTTEERAILKLLLAHQPIDDYAAAHHLMASVVIDAINEKLFDEIGDNVIAFEGDQPAVVDDYSDDVKALLE